jgi:hypothetical protein
VPNDIGFISERRHRAGCRSDHYAQFNASAFKGPGYNRAGAESGRYLPTGCHDHTFDLTSSCNIKLGRPRRLDVFNLFNNVVFNARTSAVQYGPADPTTAKNNHYNAGGTLNTARLLPANTGADAVAAGQFP